MTAERTKAESLRCRGASPVAVRPRTHHTRGTANIKRRGQYWVMLKLMWVVVVSSYLIVQSPELGLSRAFHDNPKGCKVPPGPETSANKH